MLGIVVALSWELKSLTAQRLEPGTCRPVEEHITVALSGMGADRACKAAALLAARGARALLSWGCAAALEYPLNAGSVVIPETVIGATGEKHGVTLPWHRQVCDSLSSRFVVHTGALAESAVLIKTPGQKRALGRSTGAIAADMESAAQARFARERGIPFLAVRVVIDSFPTSLPEKVVGSLNPQGEISPRSFVREILLRPSDWPALLQLCGQFCAARRTLRRSSAAVLDASARYLERSSSSASSSRRG